MTLREIMTEMEGATAHGDPGVEVTGLALDSRQVRRGDLFFALGGLRQDGRAFVEAAFAAGAAGAVVPRGTAIPHRPVLEVADPRLALAQAANRFFDHPSRALRVVGVTGTNGKTTVTWMLESIFRAAGMKPGVIGTTGYRIGDEARPAAFTTPEAPQLQALLREMVDRSVRAAALEVSSHALAQRRSYGLDCDVVIFTNCTQDHLDFHGTMEAYLDAKLMLFDGRNGGSKTAVAVVNADDPAGARVLAAAAAAGMRTLRFRLATGDAPPAPAPDVLVERIDPRPDGLALRLKDRIPDAVRAAGAGAAGPAARPGSVDFHLPLLGRHNAANAAAAWAGAVALGIDRQAARRGLETMPAVPGRLERVTAGQPFEVLVDYAHTPDALARALQAVREHARGRVLLVFGCGGDRDRAKRPLMGRAAAELADRAWVTNDNPRGEDPAAIAAEVVSGPKGAALAIVLDRRDAIAAALEAARPGDAVLIAGKGHESTQTVGGRVLPFDDREVAAALLAARRGVKA